MPEHKPTLNYAAGGIPRPSQRHATATLSLVIGVSVTVASVCYFWAISARDGVVQSFILSHVFGGPWVFGLPLLAVIGIVSGIASAMNDNESGIAAAFGIVFSFIALLASMAVGAGYFFTHSW